MFRWVFAPLRILIMRAQTPKRRAQGLRHIVGDDILIHCAKVPANDRQGAPPEPHLAADIAWGIRHRPCVRGASRAGIASHPHIDKLFGARAVPPISSVVSLSNAAVPVLSYRRGGESLPTWRGFGRRGARAIKSQPEP